MLKLINLLKDVNKIMPVLVSELSDVEMKVSIEKEQFSNLTKKVDGLRKEYSDLVAKIQTERGKKEGELKELHADVLAKMQECSSREVAIKDKEAQLKSFEQVLNKKKEELDRQISSLVSVELESKKGKKDK